MSTEGNWTSSSSARLKAKADKMALRKKKIKSPEVGKIRYHVRIGRGDFFTESKKRYHQLLAKKQAHDVDLKKFIANQIK